MAYTKLFQSIVTSTIWAEDDKTRIVWITLLAMADKNGEIQGSVPGLARIAAVSVADCERALEKLKSPDAYSRTPDNEGRRIVTIEGGWEVLNYQKYRLMASKEDEKAKATERQRRRRARLRLQMESRDCHGNPLRCHAETVTSNAPVTQDRDIAEAEAEAEAESFSIQKKIKPRKRGGDSDGAILEMPFPSDAFANAWESLLAHRKEIRKPLGKTAQLQLLKRLKGWGEAKAIQAIENTVANGWQGIFEPTETKPATATQPSPQPFDPAKGFWQQGTPSQIREREKAEREARAKEEVA